MALGHLRQEPDETPLSVLLREFLRANFPATIEATRSFWRVPRAVEFPDGIVLSDLTTYPLLPGRLANAHDRHQRAFVGRIGRLVPKRNLDNAVTEQRDQLRGRLIGN